MGALRRLLTVVTAIIILGGLLAFCVLALCAWAVCSELGASSGWDGLDDGLAITDVLPSRLQGELLARCDELESRIRATPRVVRLG